MDTRKMKERVLSPKESSVSIVQPAKKGRNAVGKNLFLIFRQGESEVHIARMARCDAQLKELMVLERRCQELMAELLSERQVLAGLMESQIRMQSKWSEK